MSDRIRSKDGKYEGVLQGTDDNAYFVVRRAADGKQISSLGPDPAKSTPSASVSPSASASPSEKPVPDDEHGHIFEEIDGSGFIDPDHMFSPTPLPPETNGLRTAHGQRFGVAVTFVVSLLGIVLLSLLVEFVF